MNLNNRPDDRRRLLLLFINLASGLPTSTRIVLARAVLQVGIILITLLPSEIGVILPSALTNAALLSEIKMMFFRVVTGLNSVLI